MVRCVIALTALLVGCSGPFTAITEEDAGKVDAAHEASAPDARAIDAAEDAGNDVAVTPPEDAAAALGRPCGIPGELACPPELKCFPSGTCGPTCDTPAGTAFCVNVLRDSCDPQLGCFATAPH